MGNQNKYKIFMSLMLKFLERIGVQLVQFVIQIILARMLIPSEFGIVSLLLVFLNIANVFVQSGLVFALVQKKDPQHIDYSTVFYISFFISIALYLLLFFTAPLISNLFSLPVLSPLLRTMGIIIIIGSLLSVQNAYAVKNSKMKVVLFSSIVSVILSGIIAVVLAVFDFGVWALVIQMVLYNAINSIIYLVILDWKPKLVFSIERGKKLFSFGWKIMISNLLNALYQDLRTFYIGFKFTSSQLAFYDRGKQIPNLFIKNVDGSIQTILLPVLSEYQNNVVLLREKTRLAMRISSYFIFPLMLGLFAVAEPLIILLLTDRWIEAVVFVQIFALTYLFRPIQTSNLQAISALGKSDVYLILEIIRLAVSLVILVISIPFGIYAIATGGILAGFLASIINAFPNKKIINYSYLDQIKDVTPTLLISIVMLLVIYPIKYLIHSNILLLFTQFILGVLVYLFLSIVFKNSTFIYLKKMFLDFLRKMKP